MKKKVLLLDIDYTVINTDSMIDFFIYSIKLKPFKTLIKLPYIFLILLMYILKISPLKKAKEAIFYPIVDFNEEELEEFFILCLKDKINKNIETIIKKSQKEDYFILMVTASPYAYMKYFKKYGYADEVIGTELHFENNRYKNLIIGENCKGEEKIRRIEDLLQKQNIEIDYKNSYAYSDSKSDMPMLRMVENAYLVSKSNGKIKEKINKNKDDMSYINTSSIGD